MMGVQSNYPYKRVDDGVGSGLISGAVVGGAMAGGFHIGGRMATREVGLGVAMGADMLSGGRMAGAASKVASGVGRAASFSNKMHAKAFGGSGKRKALAYGGSVLAGSLLGAGIDAMND